MRWVRRIAFGILVVVIAAGAISYLLYRLWLGHLTGDLSTDSRMAQTARGPMEYIALGTGRPILMVHGTPGGYDMARTLLVTGADMKAARYIVPTRPGYLRTPLATGRTPDEQAQAYAALLDTLHIQRVAVIGISGGGPSAIAFAIRYPERCAMLVLEEAVTRPLHFDGDDGPFPGQELVQDYLVWLASHGLKASWQRRAPNDPLIPAISDSVLRTAIPHARRAEGQGNDFQQMTHMKEFALERITAPTLILQGTADKNVDPAMADYAHAHIAGSELVKLPGYDHFMVIYAHKQLQDIIAKFLRAHMAK